MIFDIIRAQEQAREGSAYRLLFQDEGRFGRINKVRRCWAPPGLRPEVGQQIVREYTHAYVAVCPHDGAMVSLVLPKANTDMMSMFLNEVSARYPDEVVILVLDGAGWHRANELKIPDNLKLISLPPYSPELNPVENLWEEVREKWFLNLVFDSLDAVETVLVEALGWLENNPAVVAGIAGFSWLVNISLKAP